MPPTDWSRRKIGDLAAVVTGGTPARGEPRYWGGDIPWMSSGEVHNRNIWDTKEKITAAGLQASNARWIPEGTVVIALNGQGKTRGTVALLRRPVTCNQSLAGIVPGHDLDPGFLRYSLEARYTALRSLTGDESRSGLNLELVRSIEVLVPPLPEQRKIAAILSSIDDTIERTEAVIRRLEAISKALVQDLLKQGVPGRHRRFRKTKVGEIPETWDVVALGEVLDGIDAGWSPQCEGHPAPLGEWGILKVSAVTSGRYLESEQKALPAGLSPSPDIEVQAGDVVLARANGVIDLVGRTVLVRETRPRLMLSDKLLRLRPTKNRLHESFLWLTMRSEPVRSRLLAMTGGSHMRNVSQATLRSLLLPLPCLDEQVQIGQVVDGVELRVESETSVLAALHALKSVLLSALLSGEIPVDPEAAVA